MSISDAGGNPNQTPPLQDVDLVTLDRPLFDALRGQGVDFDREGLTAFGHRWGTAERLDLGRLANENPPTLHSYDPRGNRLDTVEFHPAYHHLMQASMEDGLHASTWTDATPLDLRSSRHAARAARLFVIAGVEAGHVCPLTMTHASIAALSASPQRLGEWLPKIQARAYDPRFIPFWEKTSVTLGMGMTERQGGTDVRLNTTRAEHRHDDEYALTGQKWFMSAPMSDGFLVLAQAQGGLTCFLLPRFRPDGTVNGLRLQRLKDKLGNRSNASAEVAFEDAFAWRIGEEGRGITTILKMVQLTRLDCAVSSAGLVRMGLAHAFHHAHHRQVFGKKLIDQPLMRSVLADLALESEAMTALSMRLARSFDSAGAAQGEAGLSRLVTPTAKFGICKAAPRLLYELMECLGGNGYVEESPLPRLYREAPVNAIWEGSGNVIALDILRTESRESEVAAEALTSLMAGIEDLPGARDTASAVIQTLRSPEAESCARFIADRLYALAAASALAASAPPEIVEAWARTRLVGPAGIPGSNDLGMAAGVLLERAFPPI